MEDREIVQLDKVREFASGLQPSLSSIAAIKLVIQESKNTWWFCSPPKRIAKPLEGVFQDRQNQ